MLRNYLKIAGRSLWRNRLFTTINVVSLAVGIAAMTLVFLIVDLLFINFDLFHANADRLYFLHQESASMRANASSVAPALPVLLRDYPAIENGTRLLFRETNWLTYRDRDVRKTIMHVDTGFFNVLTLSPAARQRPHGPERPYRPDSVATDRRRPVRHRKSAGQISPHRQQPDGRGAGCSDAHPKEFVVPARCDRAHCRP